MKKRISGTSSYWKWIGSYLLLLAVITVVFIVISFTTYHHIKRQVQKSNEGVISTMKTAVDDIFESVNNMSINIFLTDTFSAPARYADVATPDERWTVNECQGLLKRYKTSYSFIKEIGVYYPNIDFIISGSDTASTVEYMYKRFPVITEKKSADGWREDIAALQNSICASDKDIMYVQKFPVRGAVRGAAQVPVLMVIINRGSILKSVDERQTGSGGFFAIENAGGDILLMSETKNYSVSDARSDIKTIPLDSEKPHTMKTSSGKRLAVFSREAENKQLKYIYAVENSNYYRPIINMVYMTLAALILLLAVYIYLAFYYAGKHYRPIKEIMGKLSYAQVVQDAKSDEFQTIGSAVEKLSDAVDIIGNEYKAFMFNHLVVTNMQTEHAKCSISEIFRNFDVNFEYPRYVMITLSIHYTGENSSEITWDEPEMEGLVRPALDSALKNNLSESNDMMTFTVRADVFLILVGCADYERDRAMDTMRRLQKDLRRQYAIYCSLIVGKPFEDLDFAAEEYRKHTELGYTGEFDRDDILFCGDEEYTDAEFKMGRPSMSLENKLVAAVQRGDDAAQELMREYIQSFEMQKRGGREYFSAVKYSVWSFLAHLMEVCENRENYNAVFEKITALTDNNIQALTSIACESIQALNMSPKAQTHIKEARLTENIKQYIAEHLDDINLNVERLGIVFELNANYLSKIFKQQTGELLKDYILKIRMKEAKRLLTTTNEKIADIAKKVGYTEITSFNRRFKSVTGVSPSQYRSIK